MTKGKKPRLTREKILEELAAIGFARATDYLQVAEDKLIITDTSQLKKRDGAAICSMERTSNGIKVKFYDKLKALELLGKYMGLFSGADAREQPENNLLEMLLQMDGEEMTADDIPELQQAAKTGDDLVEDGEMEEL